jgi:Flp pilus assembly protein TadG
MCTSMSSTNRPVADRAGRGSRERGHAVVEFALGFTLLWMIFSGVYELGTAFYAYNVLKTSVSNAAQLGSRLEYDTAHPSDYSAKLKNMVVYGDVTAGTAPQLPGLTTGNVNVSLNLDDNNMPRGVTVSITGYSLDALFKTFNLNGKPRATTAYLGRVLCSDC